MMSPHSRQWRISQLTYVWLQVLLLQQSHQGALP